MEGKTGISTAKQIMGINFIGPDELNNISTKIGIPSTFKNYIVIPDIPFGNEILKKKSENHILILGISKNKDDQPLNINNLRSFFGIDPVIQEPCFYNQDWYVNEEFANRSIELKWYLINKNIREESRGLYPEQISGYSDDKETNLPSAILCCFTFFAFYYISGEILWKHDYIWCNDFDKNGDRIYVGRYLDPIGLNKNGFSVHRNLKINKQYGSVYVI